MTIVTASEWLNSLQILTTLNRCAWILAVSAMRPVGVSEPEEAQLNVAVIAAFQLRISTAVKVALPIDVIVPASLQP